MTIFLPFLLVRVKSRLRNRPQAFDSAFLGGVGMFPRRLIMSGAAGGDRVIFFLTFANHEAMALQADDHPYRSVERQVSETIARAHSCGG